MVHFIFKVDLWLGNGKMCQYAKMSIYKVENVKMYCYFLNLQKIY